MPARKGAFGVVKIGSTPDVIAQLRNWNQPNETNEIDITVMGTGNAAMIPGTKSENLECDLFFDPDDTGQAFLLANLGSDTPYPVEVYPFGEGSGEWVWNANCYIMAASPTAAADGAVEYNGVRLVSDSAGGAWTKIP